MGCRESHESATTGNEEREPFIPQLQNDTELLGTVSELRHQVNKCNIKIKNLNEKLTQAQNTIEEKQINVDDQEDEIAQLKSTISDLEKLAEELKTEKQSLVTRLSQISSVMLTEGNPNIADLSDPNRPDKLVEQFSELYDNQWTDSFQVLCESQSLSEGEAIQVLLKIILTVYEVCRCEVEHHNEKLGKALSLFTGVEVIDQANESVIQESLHNLRSFRAKKYALAMHTLKGKIGASLQSSVGSDVYIVCQDYVAECIKVCWLMCVKSPLMYISAEKNEEFDHTLYTNYTKSGKYVSYVVWPTLFQYKNGPIMKKGVAQGTN